MLVDRDKSVPHELARSLCELAQWAPNHKRTWPWRFAIAEGSGRTELGDAIADAMQHHGAPEDRVLKTRGKYLRTPATLVVGSAQGDSQTQTLENRDAVAAGVQNILLGATAAGLASYWGSCPEISHQSVATLCQFEDGTHISALIYLGWPTSPVEAPMRPHAHIHTIG